MSLSAAELTFVVIVGIILLASVVCNILVIVVVALNPQLRNPTNVLICNLAVSDLVLASLVLPQNLHDISHADDSYTEGDFLCRVVYTCPLLCIMGSIYSMVAISFDRTYAILLNANKKLTFRTAAMDLAVIWILSVLFCVPTMHEYSEFVVEENENGTILGCGSNGVSYVYSVVNGVGLLLLAYVIPLAVMMFNYGKILAFFKSKGMFGKQATERGAVFQALFKTRMTVVKMLIRVAVLFAVSWAPYFTLLLLEKPGEHSHAPLSPGTLKSFSIIKHMRQRIADDPGRPVPRIYNDVVSQALSSSLEATDTLAASLPPFQSIRSTLYRERKKWTPPLPKDGLELQLFNEHKMKKLSCGQGRMIHESPHEHMHKTTLDQHETTSDEHEMTSDERHTTSDEHQATSYKRRITSDKHQITSDERQVTVNERQMKSDEHQPTSDERHMTSNKRHMTSSEHQATSNEHQATSDECRMTSDEHQATSDECHMTSDECQPTCGDGIVVKVEHCEEDA